MNNNEIIENNKLIAEFMGKRPKCECDGVYSFSDMPFFSIRENDIETVINGIANYVKYHTSWEWLMSVVEKIESISIKEDEEVKFLLDFETSTMVNWNLTNGYAYNDELSCIKGTTKKEAVYNAVVKFIKWYNTNNIK